jgi:hypothetical protein
MVSAVIKAYEVFAKNLGDMLEATVGMGLGIPEGTSDILKLAS